MKKRRKRSRAARAAAPEPAADRSAARSDTESPPAVVPDSQAVAPADHEPLDRAPAEPTASAAAPAAGLAAAGPALPLEPPSPVRDPRPSPLPSAGPLAVHTGVVWAVAVVLVASIVVWEMKTSTLQSYWFTHYASTLTWSMQDGPCVQQMPSQVGPYDARLGYRHIEELRHRLTRRDFVIARQACPSPALARLAARGIAPPYDEKDTGTLRILDRTGSDLYRASLDRHHFGDYGEIPALLVSTLLYIENRHLLDERPTLNPALEWDRLFLAGAHYALDKVANVGNTMGGSTLATQLEKFRHSPDGRTAGGLDKLRQIISASLRAYRRGRDTRAARRDIVVDYINTMPLGAAPGEGEITGLGHGMWAWFEKTPRQLVDDLTLTEEGANLRRKAETYKQALALVMATRRPALYLDQDPSQLERRIQSFLPLLVQDGVISQRLAQGVSEVKLRFRTQVPQRQKVPFIDRKATNAVRAELLDVLDAQSLYALDRYDLRVETSLDSELQEKVVSIFRQLSDRDFLARHGFYGERLLGGADPSRVVYSFSLYESTPWGNRLRVHADNLNAPLDINRDVKLELGSTAKLRTMANYLMVIASLYARYREASPEALAGAERVALDPITRWTSRWLRARPGASLEQLLDASLDRPFSADPNEQFFTGQGLHTFGNFDDTIEGPVPLRIAFQHSVNLAYIRLMRELVQYYTAELGYDSRSILADADSPARRELLDAAMDHEARETLWSFYRRYHGFTPDEIVRRLCGKNGRGLRRLAIFHLAEHHDATFEDLLAESRRLYGAVATETTVRAHFAAFAGKVRSAQDEAYLLGRHPLEVWLVRDLRRDPAARWGEVLERSREVREASSEWIERSRFKHAQDQRLRIELERRAFREIHKAWKALGYPFDSLVPSLATAIGSSADRPQALAELVGIIQNDGMRTPFLRVEALHFAEGTPYETHFEPASGTGERVMPRDVARALKALMQQVVREGTGRRVHGALRAEDGSVIAIGGKTGSGDNRHERFSSSGALLSSRAVSRTASFVFVIGDRFFGMVSAYVGGEDADRYHFTSTLALQTFRALAPVIEPVVAAAEVQHAARPGSAAGPTGLGAGPPGSRARTAGAP